MLPGYTHNIINLSETEDLVTLMWANESLTLINQILTLKPSIINHGFHGLTRIYYVVIRGRNSKK